MVVSNQRNAHRSFCFASWPPGFCRTQNRSSIKFDVLVRQEDWMFLSAECVSLQQLSEQVFKFHRTDPLTIQETYSGPNCSPQEKWTSTNHPQGFDDWWSPGPSIMLILAWCHVHLWCYRRQYDLRSASSCARGASCDTQRWRHVLIVFTNSSYQPMILGHKLILAPKIGWKIAHRSHRQYRMQPIRIEHNRPQ